MNPTSDDSGSSHVQPLAFGEVAELQDQLFEAATDLDRLGGLLEDATRQLMERFSAANEQAQSLSGDPLLGKACAGSWRGRSQPCSSRIWRRRSSRTPSSVFAGVADFLGARAVADDDEADSVAVVQLVRRHCPVAQRQVDAGSIELF
jgi:hypothetical protein